VTFCQISRAHSTLIYIEPRLGGSKRSSFEKDSHAVEPDFSQINGTKPAHSSLTKAKEESYTKKLKGRKNAKHTAAGIPTWSPTVVLICRSTAYVWQSGRDAQFSADCGRMCWSLRFITICRLNLRVEPAAKRTHSTQACSN
jgi:hypothetical protein